MAMVGLGNATAPFSAMPAGEGVANLKVFRSCCVRFDQVMAMTMAKTRGCVEMKIAEHASDTWCRYEKTRAQL